jgi:hypothetical protein
LGADGSPLYVLDEGVDPPEVLALPALRALLGEAGEYTVAFLGP